MNAGGNKPTWPDRNAQRGRVAMRCALGLAALFLASCGHPTPASSATGPGRGALRDWWTHYKERFVAPSGRVVRPRDGNDAVSEGQAYGMLYAVLLDDRETFERILSWTRSNLGRRVRHGDRLLAWRWRDGRVVDWNAASDADLDYAQALVLAHRRWGEPAYLAQAQSTAQDILRLETRRVTGWGTVLLPGTWGETTDGGWVTNPSYFSPAAFRTLHEATGNAEWIELAETTYRVWRKSGGKIGRTRGRGLPPDWCVLSKGRRLRAAPARSASYGWEAVRIPMRAGMDALLHGRREAKRMLRRGPVAFFRGRFRRGEQGVAAVYGHDGTVEDGSESLAMTAMVLFGFQACGEKPPAALIDSFERQRAGDTFRDDYYGQSLAFYPLAFRSGVFEQEWLTR